MAQMKNSTIVILAVLVVALFLGGIWYIGNSLSADGGGGGGGSGGGGAGDGTISSFAGCPDDGDTSLKIEIKNSGNLTGDEEYDISGYLYRIEGGQEVYFTAIADNTNPTATTIDCGYDYIYKMVGASGASGDLTVISSVIGEGTIVDGNLKFTADKSNMNFILKVPQHASLEATAYDNINRGGIYESSSDEDQNNYEVDGVVWQSTVNNTVYTETNGIDISFTLRAVETDTEYNDRGIFVLVEAPVAVWTAPSIKIEGTKLEDATSLLNSHERISYADYEYVFMIPQSLSIKDEPDGVELRWGMNLATGVGSASADPEVDLAVRSQALSIDGFTVFGPTAVTDAATPVTVHTHFDMSLDIA